MLQQTTVAAVIPYFQRFLGALPTVQALAKADEQHVLKLWEGLGYYRRARHLHAAARILVAQHGSALPDDPAVWGSLPGVGRYILGAVLSQAFDRKLAIVEANSLRVLSRLLGYRGDPRVGIGKVWVWAAAEALLPAKRTGDFNQAIMELGALVCTATRPACGNCPLATMCTARHENLQDRIPPPRQRVVRRRVKEVGVVIRDRGRILFCRRPGDAVRWQNMWEVPHAPYLPGESTDAAAQRIARVLVGMNVTPGGAILELRHSVTRSEITLHCVEAVRRGGTFAPAYYSAARWLTPAETADLPVSSPQRKLISHLAACPEGQATSVRRSKADRSGDRT